MKLSEKGYLKIGNSIVGWLENGVAKVTFDPDKIEFEPDDFEGGCFQNGKDHIVLTVEEAEILTRCAANEFCRLILEHAPVDLARQVEILMYDLVRRIEQAEGKR